MTDIPPFSIETYDRALIENEIITILDSNIDSIDRTSLFEMLRDLNDEDLKKILKGLKNKVNGVKDFTSEGFIKSMVHKEKSTFLDSLAQSICDSEKISSLFGVITGTTLDYKAIRARLEELNKEELDRLIELLRKLQ